jgi:hypothetical protein
MKVTVKTTETKTSEIDVQFPTFTKIKSWIATYYYAVLSEDEAVRITDYQNIVGSFGRELNISKAFDSDFEFIDEVQFKNALLKFQNNTNDECHAVLDSLKEFKADAKADQDRAEYFEYQDIEKESKEEIEIEY